MSRPATSMSLGAHVELDQTLEEAFPQVDPNHEPAGSSVLVQIRSPKAKTRGGILLASETQETIAHNTQVAKVIALGPVAFRNRETLAPWPEGAWCAVGDYVRVPKYSKDMFEVRLKDGSIGIFAQFNDLELKGKTPRPLDVVAFV